MWPDHRGELIKIRMANDRATNKSEADFDDFVL